MRAWGQVLSVAPSSSSCAVMLLRGAAAGSPVVEVDRAGGQGANIGEQLVQVLLAHVVVQVGDRPVEKPSAPAWKLGEGAGRATGEVSVRMGVLPRRLREEPSRPLSRLISLQLEAHHCCLVLWV